MSVDPNAMSIDECENWYVRTIGGIIERCGSTDAALAAMPEGWSTNFMQLKNNWHGLATDVTDFGRILYGPDLPTTAWRLCVACWMAEKGRGK